MISAKAAKTTPMLSPRPMPCVSSQRTSGSSASATKRATPMETSTVDSEEIAPARERAIRAPTVAVKPHTKGCPRSIMSRRCGARWAVAGPTAGRVTTGCGRRCGHGGLVSGRDGEFGGGRRGLGHGRTLRPRRESDASTSPGGLRPGRDETEHQQAAADEQQDADQLAERDGLAQEDDAEEDRDDGRPGACTAGERRPDALPQARVPWCSRPRRGRRPAGAVRPSGAGRRRRVRGRGGPGEPSVHLPPGSRRRPVPQARSRTAGRPRSARTWRRRSRSTGRRTCRR